MLAVGGVLWEIVLGVPIGIIAAYRPRGVLDRVTTLGALLGLSAPPFWLGLLLLYFLAYKLNLFPLSGYGAPVHQVPDPAELHPRPRRRGVVLAADPHHHARRAALARTSQMARLKGMPERTVLLRHCLRNVLTPLLTMLGMDLGYFLGGVVVIESVFGLPGVGKLTFDAIGTLDIPMITGAVLFAAFFIVVMNFVVDLTYTVVDPRVRLSRR